MFSVKKAFCIYIVKTFIIGTTAEEISMRLFSLTRIHLLGFKVVQNKIPTRVDNYFYDFISLDLNFVCCHGYFTLLGLFEILANKIMFVK